MGLNHASYRHSAGEMTGSNHGISISPQIPHKGCTPQHSMHPLSTSHSTAAQHVKVLHTAAGMSQSHPSALVHSREHKHHACMRVHAKPASQHACTLKILVRCGHGYARCTCIAPVTHVQQVQLCSLVSWLYSRRGTAQAAASSSRPLQRAPRPQTQHNNVPARWHSSSPHARDPPPAQWITQQAQAAPQPTPLAKHAQARITHATRSLHPHVHAPHMPLSACRSRSRCCWPAPGLPPP